MLQIRPQLGQMNGEHLLDCFQLKQDFLLDDDIGAVRGTNNLPIEADADRHFTLHLDPLADQPTDKAGAIRALEESWPQAGVDIESASQDALGKLHVSRRWLLKIPKRLFVHPPVTTLIAFG